VRGGERVEWDEVQGGVVSGQRDIVTEKGKGGEQVQDGGCREEQKEREKYIEKIYKGAI
jgi:hypothetical protein